MKITAQSKVTLIDNKQQEYTLSLSKPEIAFDHLQVHEYDDNGRPRRVSDSGSSFAAGDFKSTFGSPINAYMGHKPLPSFIGGSSQFQYTHDPHVQEMINAGWKISPAAPLNNNYDAPLPTLF